MSKFITLSAGHGAQDPGAVGNGYKERDLTMELVNLIKKYLDDGYTGFTIKAQQEKVSPKDFRSSSAYGGPSGFYMSVHFNAGGGHGTEILQGRFGDSRCKVINNVLAKYFTNRGIKKVDTNDYYMLRECGFDMIAEICFIDSKSDMDTYQKNKYKIAKDLADAIAKYEGLSKKSNIVTEYTTARGIGSHYDKGYNSAQHYMYEGMKSTRNVYRCDDNKKSGSIPKGGKQDAWYWKKINGLRTARFYSNGAWHYFYTETRK